MIFFRVDGNPQIGSGHIMRCLSLAKALRAQGCECVFVTADCQMKPAIAAAGFPNIVLETAWNEMESELPALLPLLQKEEPSCMIVDGYFVTEKWMQAVRSTTTLVYMDDLNAQLWPVDVLINYNLYAQKMGYEQRYEKTDTKLILGASYAPLREEFQNLPKRVPNKTVKNLLVSTGGADAEHVALHFLQYLNDEKIWQNINIHLVVGALNLDLAELQKLEKQLPHVTLHRHVQKMSELMLSCDLAIAAAGSTLYELCACGVPTVTYTLADNQLLGAKAFAEMKLMVCVGDYRSNVNFFADIANAIKDMENSGDKRKAMSKQMRTVVDGNGANRLAMRLQKVLCMKP